MSARTLRLVLLISCCHALVHVYELSFASVEQIVAGEFGVNQAVTGWLGFSLRLPLGLCALGAGWLADRFGGKPLLLIYLFGSSAAAALACYSPSLAVLFVAMFTLGVFASIYHPAGVSLISHYTNPENRALALGYHGILGSAGIAAGPFLAALALGWAVDWRGYYLLLMVPGVLLGLILMGALPHDRAGHGTAEGRSPAVRGDEDHARWGSYWTLILATMLAGFVYAAVMNFLPRYLDSSGLDLSRVPKASLRNVLAGAVLLLGIFGQYAAGRLARPRTLEPLLAAVFLATAPCLVWMGMASGWWRIAAAAVFAPVFFMHQPLYNTLVAKYVPPRRRSLAYGLSFSLSFGVGSTGSAFAGKMATQFGPYGTLVNHMTLAVVILVAAGLAAVLWRTAAPAEPLRLDGAGETPGEPLAP